MRDSLLFWILLAIISAGVYYLFPAFSVPVFREGFPSKETFAVFWPELLFILTGFIMFLLLSHIRTMVLLVLIFGQMSLLFHDGQAWLYGKIFPLYGIIAVNGIVFLFLYFLVSSHLWAPKELELQDYDP